MSITYKLHNRVCTVEVSLAKSASVIAELNNIVNLIAIRSL